MRVVRLIPILFTLRKILAGIFSYIPGVTSLAHRTIVKVEEVGIIPEARYRYSTWLRYLVVAYQYGLPTQPEVVVELGPGASIGVGLAALISGSSEYFGLDVVKRCNPEKDTKIFDQLIELFNKREAIPGESEFPVVLPRLKSYEFPGNILTEERLKASLESDRIAFIRNSLAKMESVESNPIQYVVPWQSSEIINKLESCVDMVCSQTVLEYVDNLEDVYKLQYLWLRPGGYVSHEIPFGSLGLAAEWNGHWRYSELAWKLVHGNKPFFINRQPHSAHLKLLRDCGFEVACSLQYRKPTRIQKKHLAPRWRNVVSEDDLTCSAAFIQAVKNFKPDQ